MKKTLIVISLTLLGLFSACEEETIVTIQSERQPSVEYNHKYIVDYSFVNPLSYSGVKIHTSIKEKREITYASTDNSSLVPKEQKDFFYDSIYIYYDEANPLHNFANGELQSDDRVVKQIGSLPDQYVSGHTESKDRTTNYQFSWTDDTAKYYIQWTIRHYLNSDTIIPQWVSDTAWYVRRN